MSNALLLLACLCVGCSDLLQAFPESSHAAFPERVNYEKAARLHVALGLHYLQQQELPLAKAKLLRAQALAPHLSEVHGAYASFLEQVGETKAAEAAYLKAIRLQSQNSQAHNNYGVFLCRQKRYAQAEKEFLKAIRDPKYPHTAQVYENAGLCVLQIPNREKAIGYLKKALQHDPHRSLAFLTLAKLQEDLL